MRALLFSIGTRGDAEPFLAIAEILKNDGWEVACVFPEQFRNMVEETGITFHGFDKRFLELLESNTGKTFMGGSGSFIDKIKTLVRLSKESLKLQGGLIETQRLLIEKYSPDKIFFHPKCVYPILWEIANPGTNILVCPIPCILHKVNDYTTMGMKGNGNYGTVINSLSYWLVNWIRAAVFFKMSKKQRKGLNQVQIGPKVIYQTMVHKIKTFYTISPSLFPKPEYWSDHLHVTGFVERNRTLNWHPDEKLLQLLAHHHKILFVTFGSMTNSDPKEKTEAILEVLLENKIPAIINTSWGGLVKTNHCNDHIYFVDNIPYEWILPKMYAIVHHGGSGTTHAACKHGCPSLIIPHIVDQFFWNKRIASIGLGPRGIPINQLTKNVVRPLLMDLWQKRSYKENTLKISDEMAQEGRPDNILALL